MEEAHGPASEVEVGGDEVEAMLVDDVWVPIEGGPFTANLLSKRRSTLHVREFGCLIPFDPARNPIYAGGAIRFVDAPGAPEGGIICHLPSRWEAGARQLMFHLRLSKQVATGDKVTINTVLYRKQRGADEDGASNDGSAWGDDVAAAAAAVEHLEGSGSMAALEGVDANKMSLWWDANGGLAICGFDPETWALQLSARLAAAKEVNDAFKVNFNADLVHMSDEMLRSFDDGFYLVEMKKLVMEQGAPEPPPSAGKGGNSTMVNRMVDAQVDGVDQARLQAKLVQDGVARMDQAAYRALEGALASRGLQYHWVENDHHCLYWALLHAFTSQLPATHKANIDAQKHYKNDCPPKALLHSITTYMANHECLHSLWDMEDLSRYDAEECTLEKTILRIADWADFKRGQKRSVASLLQKMQTESKPWGTEIVLTFFVPVLYDVVVTVCFVDQNGSWHKYMEHRLPPGHMLSEPAGRASETPAVTIGNIENKHFVSTTKRSDASSSTAESANSITGGLSYASEEDDGMTPAEVAKLTVPKLKEALEKRGLETTGLKAVLAERLFSAIANPEPAVGGKRNVSSSTAESANSITGVEGGGGEGKGGGEAGQYMHQRRAMA